MSLHAAERPTRILVDLDRIAGNLRAIRAHAGVPVMAIVKANAYGHGLVPVARHLQAVGVEEVERERLRVPLAQPVAEAQEEDDTLRLLLCVPVAHCVPDALTDRLAEGDRESDGVAVTHVDTDTVEDGVCDSVVVREVV